VPALLPNAGLVLKPDLDGCGRGAAEQGSFQRGGEVLFESLLRCFIPFWVKRTRLQPGQF
jgi:hypothetical protein